MEMIALINKKNRFKILTYNIGLIQQNVDHIIENGIRENDIIWLKHPYKDRFFADPFLIKEEPDYFFILCEELVFWQGKGKITLLKIRKDGFKLESKKVLIDEPWHLSFPYVYNKEFILPESHRGGKAYLYHLNKETWNIDYKKTVCEETGFVDPIIITDSDDKEWLLSTDNLSERLYLYEAGDDELFHSVSKQPLLCDKTRARSAGNMFSYKNSIVRPVQDCVERYGRQIRLERIEQISKCEYKTKKLSVINSDMNPPYDETMHTFNVYDGYVIVDGSKDVVHFPMKIIYRLLSQFSK